MEAACPAALTPLQRILLLKVFSPQQLIGCLERLAVGLLQIKSVNGNEIGIRELA